MDNQQDGYFISEKIKTKLIKGVYSLEMTEKITNKIYNMLIDTGYTQILIDQSAIQGRNQVVKKLDPRLEKEWYVGLTLLPETSIGKIPFKMECIIYRGKLLKDIKCDGVIGHTLLKNFIISFDFKNNELQLIHINYKGLDIYKILEILKLKKKPIKLFTNFVNGFVTVDCYTPKIGLMKLIIDTGGPFTVITNRNNVLKNVYNYEIANTLGPAFEFGKTYIDFRILNNKMEKRNIMVFKDGMNPDLAGEEFRDGILGMDILQDKHMIINYVDNEVYFIE